MTLAYVALGANLGDAQATIRWACDRLAGLERSRLVACSGFYKSAPLDASGPDFINAVAALETHLSAPDLLLALQALETQAGRVRSYRYAPRTLDLDLLLYGHGRIDSPLLQLPHPRMFERAFVLLPLSELDASLVPASALQTVSLQAIERL